MLKFSRPLTRKNFAKAIAGLICSRMNKALSLAIPAFFAVSLAVGLPAPAQGVDVPADPEEMILSASEIDLADFKWLKRPLVVFADSAANPQYIQQMQLITDRLDALDERDVVVITDTDPDARSQPRQHLRARGFMVVLLAKDGTIVLRKPEPWAVRELSRSIDKLPLRQQEIRDKRQTLR